ncbi:MAG: metal-sensing transcriptional repressor [Eubacterium sp.]|nr:metal-sensing transcriptional repressor [Eubacterium sp.]
MEHIYDNRPGNHGDDQHSHGCSGYNHSHNTDTYEAHGHTHHGHVHSPEEKKAVLNRLARAAGHLEKVRRMVEQDADCSEVLVQIAAVRNAINNTGKLILKNHLDHCIVHAIEDNDLEEVRIFNEAIEKFVK